MYGSRDVTTQVTMPAQQLQHTADGFSKSLPFSHEFYSHPMHLDKFHPPLTYRNKLRVAVATRTTEQDLKETSRTMANVCICWRAPCTIHTLLKPPYWTQLWGYTLKAFFFFKYFKNKGHTSSVDLCFSLFYLVQELIITVHQQYKYGGWFHKQVAISTIPCYYDLTHSTNHLRSYFIC